jgi:L-aspartate oxidase
MRKSMSRDAGGLRDAAGLDRCAAELTRLTGNGSSQPGVATWEATNLLTVATAVVVAARTRGESRGAHWRADAEGRRDEWLGHLLLELVPTAGGEPRLRRRFVPVGGRLDELGPRTAEAVAR